MQRMVSPSFGVTLHDEYTLTKLGPRTPRSCSGRTPESAPTLHLAALSGAARSREPTGAEHTCRNRSVDTEVGSAQGRTLGGTAGWAAGAGRAG